MGGKRLFLAEKPDQAKKIADALGGGSKANGGISGSDWVVTWGFGHLLTPFMPHDYDESLKKWSWEPLPFVPPKFQFQPTNAIAAKQLSSIKSFMKDASSVVISTDPDREGELIAYLILNNLKWSGPTQRLWLKDLTQAGIKKALSDLLPAEKTKPFYWAALARTYADWLVGLNVSRATSLKLAAPGAPPMSVGRVQTPVVALIVDRERKIKGFKPENYYELIAEVRTGSGTLKLKHAPVPEKRIKDLDQAKKMQAQATGATGPLSVVTEKKTQSPPPLYDMNTLQQDCNGKFGWSAAKTLELTQALYEKHDILSYPRTDCKVLPEEHKNSIGAVLSAISAVLPQAKSLLPTPQARSSVYDDKKVGAHYAIVPTGKVPDLSSLSSDETKLFKLVSTSWLAAHMPDMHYLQTTVSFNANGIVFRSGGRQITEPGWKSAFSSAGIATEEDEEKAGDEDGDADLPPLQDGDKATAEKVTVDAKTTKPPTRFTEKDLIAKMANIGADIDDPAAKKILKDTSGIGTTATRANIIETIKKRKYVTIEKKRLVPTEIAFILIDSLRKVAPAYADPITTARWEDVLNEIAGGADKLNQFVAGIVTSLRRDIEAIKNADIPRMAADPKQKAKWTNAPGGKGKSASGGNPDWKVAIQKGKPIKVTYEKREEAKALGARWDGDRKTWVIPAGSDEGPYKKAGYL